MPRYSMFDNPEDVELQCQQIEAAARSVYEEGPQLTACLAAVRQCREEAQRDDSLATAALGRLRRELELRHFEVFTEMARDRHDPGSHGDQCGSC